MATFELYGIVKSKGKTIAIGDGGKFSTEDEKIIYKLDNLGFKRIVENTPTIIEGEMASVTTDTVSIDKDDALIQSTPTEEPVIKKPIVNKKTKKVKK